MPGRLPLPFKQLGARRVPMATKGSAKPSRRGELPEPWRNDNPLKLVSAGGGQCLKRLHCETLAPADRSMELKATCLNSLGWGEGGLSPKLNVPPADIEGLSEIW